ncbi:MAG TPA: transporter [Chthoniobacterales bacterium]|nr:transporter [Chthoniobacterales bacterium]
MRRASCAIAFLGLFQVDCFAEERLDKSGYNLFRPVPDSLLREMETDRPDKTESAYTVDAGHFQVEMELLSYTRDRSKHERVESFGMASTNFKVGILNRVDLQIIVESFNLLETKDRNTGEHSRVSGFGDVTLRSKINLWGDDGGSTALSLMPFVKVPTAKHDLGNGAVEGGVIFPFAMELPCEWGLGAQVEVDHLRNEAGSSYHQEFSNTVTVSHDIVGKLAGYVELFNSVSNESHSSWVGTFDFGFTYALTRDVRLDAGMNIGLTDAADDFNPFLGLSLRY